MQVFCVCEAWSLKLENDIESNMWKYLPKSFQMQPKDLQKNKQKFRISFR